MMDRAEIEDLDGRETCLSGMLDVQSDLHFTLHYCIHSYFEHRMQSAIRSLRIIPYFTFVLTVTESPSLKQRDCLPFLALHQDTCFFAAVKILRSQDWSNPGRTQRLV